MIIERPFFSYVMILPLFPFFMVDRLFGVYYAIFLLRPVCFPCDLTQHGIENSSTKRHTLRNCVVVNLSSRCTLSFNGANWLLVAITGVCYAVHQGIIYRSLYMVSLLLSIFSQIYFLSTFFVLILGVESPLSMITELRSHSNPLNLGAL